MTDLSEPTPIRALADEYWEAVLRANPTYATFLGDRRFDTEIEDVSVAAEAEQRARWSELLERVAEVDVDDAPLAERVTHNLLFQELSEAVEHIDHRIAELRYDQMDGLAADLLTSAPQINAPEPQNALDLVERQRKVGTLVDGAIERFRAGLAAGRTPPRVVVERALHQVDGYLASPLDRDPFTAYEGPTDWDGEAAWRDALRGAAEEVVRPAFARYGAVLREELLPVARGDDEPGLCALDDGDALYRVLIRSNTGLDLEPAAIHQIGLDELAAIDEQLAELGQQMFGVRALPEIFERLRTDPALRYDPARPEEPLDDARRCVAAAAEVMGDWFGRLPVSPCEVKAVPAMLAADAPGAYYFPPAADGSRPGTYFVNTHDPAERNRFDTASVAFHESIPGHHLQLAIAGELDDLPAFQRFGTGHTAFVEGWALYSERLADEMDLYATDLDRVGMLVNDAWRACRLVVDTGMHALGWSRQQAIDHMVEHMPVGVDEITTEVDRYLAIPGQALAYKIGQREILRLREGATRTLGDRFDLPGFHDVVLGSSTISLPVLGALVADWVETRGAA
ncbi:DUF885 domain-containing protein [Iamia sp. SCSIO 61187]|uniref:DUF885 domain-containing protein n=1 Tax=Iamia sp. SCSIO 61187 TaxID=2722752 RepID=UPI001C63919A|nr:DUF885 domain-containing protein [Iamia sp. SCSIO 61187]QYG91484.1 DUF885 domain-containing protein [Iamia sp. SCSIO 61187]